MNKENNFSAPFYETLYNKEFESHIDAIHFFNSYNEEFLFNEKFIKNRLKLLNESFGHVKIKKYYKNFPSPSSVIGCIDIINKQIRNPSSNLDSDTFILDLGNGSGSFHCFEDVSINVQDAISKYNQHDYPDPVLGIETVDSLNNWATSSGIFLNKEASNEINWHIHSGGTTKACAEIFKLFSSDDIILIPTPTYGNLIALANQYAKIEILPLKKQNHWKLTGSFLEQAFNARRNSLLKPKLLVFPNPVNPTGIVYNQNEINELAKILVEHGCFVLDDIVHHGIWIDDKPNQGFFHASSASDLTFTVFGPSKTYCAAGWRLGVSHASNLQYAEKIKYNSLMGEFSTNKIYESIATACYGNEASEKYLARNNLEYRLRHALLKLFILGEREAKKVEFGEALVAYIKKIFPNKADSFLSSAHELFLLSEPKASFFQILSFKGWKGKSFGNFKIRTSFDVYQLLYACGLVTIPDLAQGYYDLEDLSVRISLSNTTVLSLSIKNTAYKSQNILAHYMLGCAIERIKLIGASLV